MCDFCSSKRRKLKCGKIVNESKHNLSRYKTAVSHCFCVYRVEHAAEVFDHAKVETYKMTCKHFFDAIKKQENDLKAKGLMKIGTGGDVFSKDFFVECSKRLLQAGDYRAALFNQTGMHTAGRMGNVGQQKTGHFRMDNDCIKIQFPLTKNDNVGEKTKMIWLHFYGNPMTPELDINLAYAIHFACLQHGPSKPGGRVFPGGANPEKCFRDAIKRAFPEPELRAKYGLSYTDLVNHSWRKTCLSTLSMGVYHPPSAATLDHRSGHNQNWQGTYYKPIENNVADHRTGRLLLGYEGTKKQKQLPAHFKEADKQIIKDAMLKCFPWIVPDAASDVSVPSTFTRCLVRYFAALVYHSEWLIQNYPDHPVHGTALFQTANLLEQLRPELGDIHGDGIALTGVSPIFMSKYRVESCSFESAILYLLHLNPQYPN